jgi:hypothetical protein
MAEQILFAKFPCLNIILLEQEFANLAKMLRSPWVDIGGTWRTRPDRRFGQSDPFFRDAAEDHPSQSSVPDRHSLEPTLRPALVPEHMVLRANTFTQRKTALGWKSGKSQTTTQKLPPGGPHKILFALSLWCLLRGRST